MPVKATCDGCDAVFNAPDGAAGKTVKCPTCGDPVKVPGAASASAKGKPAAQAGVGKSAKSSKPAKRGDPEDFLSRISEDEMEDDESRVCPYCAAFMPLPDPDDEEDEFDPVCRKCGMDTELGKMDPKEARKRARKGPDPALFYKAAWVDSWEFTLEHFSLPRRLGVSLGVFSVGFLVCHFMVNWCTNGPPRAFWAFLAFVFASSFFGGIWWLMMRIVGAEIMKEEIKPDRIHFDFFGNAALGLRAIIWPLVVMLPVTFPVVAYLGLVTALTGEAPTVALKILGALAVIPYPALPIATAHFTSKYRHNAWIGWELLLSFFKHIVPCTYIILVGTVVVGLTTALWLVPQMLVLGNFNPLLSEKFLGWMGSAATWCLGLIGEASTSGWQFVLVQMCLSLTVLALTYIPIMFVMGFCYFFMFRVYALFVLYYQPSLNLVQTMPMNAPAGFWVRLLAFMGDLATVPFAPFVAAKEKNSALIAWALSGFCGLTYFFVPMVFPLMVLAWFVFQFWMYFAAQESSNIRTTIVKDAFGLIVSTERDRQITIRQATGRVFLSLLSGLGLGVGFVMCAFHPQRRALHDLMTKTKVVFKGDK